MSERETDISGCVLRKVIQFEIPCPDLVRAFEGARHRAKTLYRRESDGSEILAIGVATLLEDDDNLGPDSNASVDPSFAQKFRHFAPVTTQLACDEKAALCLLGWTAFDPGHPRQSWSSFPRHILYVPEVFIRRLPGGATDDKAQVVVAAGAGDPDSIWHRWCTLLTAPPPPEDLSEEATATTALEEELDAIACSPFEHDGSIKTLWLDDERFRQGVRHVIGTSTADKVVLARRAIVEASAPLDVCSILDVLDRRFPSCTVFAISARPGRPVFIGATPERLAASVASDLSTMALAGTTRQGSGDSLPRQEAEEALLQSSKDLEEHRFVVEMILQALRPLSLTVEASPEPKLRRLANVSHLETPITARLREVDGFVDAVDALHPTPAVCGVPRNDARRLIAELEGFDRGLYAGAFGWLDGAGNGSFDVALRCGLIEGSRALLYAGAGITAESDVETEHAETLRKLDALRGAIAEAALSREAGS